MTIHPLYIKLFSKNNININIFNKGDFERDFIHVNDVVNIYDKFILNNSNGIYEVG